MAETKPVARVADAHHHLWDLSQANHPWLSGPDAEPAMRSLQRNYLVADFLADATGVRLIRSVHVEAAAADSLRETSWLQSVADETGFPHAIVAAAVLEDEGAPELLAQHLEHRSVRGIRQMLNRNPVTGQREPTELMKDPLWRHGLQEVGRHGLVFDLQVDPQQLGEAATLAADEPGITFALNHGGFGAPISPDNERAWRDGIQALASCPNVVVKTSGYDTVDPSWSGYEAYLRYLVSTFGPDRVLFASNFPIDRRSISYPDLVARTAAALQDLDDQETDQIFYVNAARIYRPER